MTRSPPLPWATSSAPSASITAGMSEAGSPWASVPPSVPRWRTCGSPIWPAVNETIGQCSARRVRGDGCMTRQRADRDVVAAVADVGEIGEPADVDQHRRPGDAELHQRDQRMAAGEQLRVARRVPSSSIGVVDRLSARRSRTVPGSSPSPPGSRARHAPAWPASGCPSRRGATSASTHRVDHRRGGGDRARLPDALHAERVGRARASPCGRARRTEARPPTGRGRSTRFAVWRLPSSSYEPSS